MKNSQKTSSKYIKYLVIYENGHTIPNLEKTKQPIIIYKNKKLLIGKFDKQLFIEKNEDFLIEPSNIKIMKITIEKYLIESQLLNYNSPNNFSIICPPEIASKMNWQ